MKRKLTPEQLREIEASRELSRRAREYMTSVLEKYDPDGAGRIAREYLDSRTKT